MHTELISQTRQTNVPLIIKGLPDFYFKTSSWVSFLPLLGFQKHELYWVRNYKIGNRSIKVSVNDIGVQYVIVIDPKEFNDRRNIHFPFDYFVIEDITPIEFLAVLWVELKKKSFINTSLNPVSQDLVPGFRYLEELETLKQSIPAWPTILVDRELFRFNINMLKKEIPENCEEYISINLVNRILKIQFREKIYYINTIDSWRISNEIITIKASEIKDNFPKRFYNKTVSLELTSGNLLGMNAEWDGEDLSVIEALNKHYYGLFKRLQLRAPLIAMHRY